MLLKNNVLDYIAPELRRVRVLWLDLSRDLAYVYRMNEKNAMPERACVASLLDDIAQRRASVLRHDPFQDALAPDTLPAKHRALRDRAWTIIEGLLQDEMGLYQPRTRGALVLRHSAACGVSYPTLYRYLRRYWERGQHINALLPDYCNSGAPGKTRGSQANVKRGRPRKAGQSAGLNADAAIRLTFRMAVARYAEGHAAFCRRAAYRQMIQEFFQEREAGALPSFGQFNYWIEKDACLIRPAAAQQKNLPHKPE